MPSGSKLQKKLKIMDDDLLKPLVDEEEVEDELDDDLLVLGKKKPKVVGEEDDSLDALADEEDGILPEDSFDDVAPEDLW